MHAINAHITKNQSFHKKAFLEDSSCTQVGDETSILNHLFPMHPFSTFWKHQKTVSFSHVFGGKRKGTLGTNGLNLYELNIFQTIVSS